MIFNSLLFPLFFIAVLALYYSPLTWRGKKLVLLGASYVFYGAWNPVFLLLLLASTVLDWFAARAMESRTGRARTALLLVSLCANLGLLATFKYGNFILESVATLLGWFGWEAATPRFDVLLPVGISFYTFQTLSYTIDVYRGHLRSEPSIADFALFVAFFPQLVAGPIVRAADFLPQLRSPKRATADQFGWGLTLILIGLFEKSVLADGYLAPVVDTVYAPLAHVSTLDAWLGTLAFSGQIFCDFAGYSLCAIGAAMCFGFTLTDNFRSPYASQGFSDFWRRWHMSLSTWLRDYLYIPLGGNRSGATRTYINLALTMLLGGLWHGASWTFVIWGALHGTYLIVERLLRGWRSQFRQNALSVFVAVVTTYALTNIAWVFFRATDLAAAGRLVKTMFGGAAEINAEVLPMSRLLAAGVMGMLLAAHWYFRERTLESVWEQLKPRTQAVVIAALILSLILGTGNSRAFIYFQF